MISDISVLPVSPQLELLKLECKVFLLKLKDFKNENNGIDVELIQDFYDIAFVIDDCIKKKPDGAGSENTVLLNEIKLAESKICHIAKIKIGFHL